MSESESTHANRRFSRWAASPSTASVKIATPKTNRYASRIWPSNQVVSLSLPLQPPNLKPTLFNSWNRYSRRITSPPTPCRISRRSIPGNTDRTYTNPNEVTRTVPLPTVCRTAADSQNLRSAYTHSPA